MKVWTKKMTESNIKGPIIYNKVLKRIATVSYTHLDVYKRQPLFSALRKSSNWFIRFSNLSTF